MLGFDDLVFALLNLVSFALNIHFPSDGIWGYQDRVVLLFGKHRALVKHGGMFAI